MHRLPVIGDWITFCCEEDLREIKTKEELDEVLEDVEEHGLSYYEGPWVSEEEALKDLQGNE